MNLNVEFDEAPQRMGVDMGELYKIPGADGVSPTVELSKKNGVTTLTITDVNGTQSVEILDGKDADTPIKGTDYYTAEDKAEMVTAVLAALPVYAGEVEIA